MSITVKISPEAERALREQAETQGRQAADLLRDLIEETYTRDSAGSPSSESVSEQEDSLYDLLSHRIGRVEGTGEANSIRCGERFTDHLVEKRERGRL